MSSINRVVLVGNLTADPESIADGKGVRLSVAVNERVKKGEEWVDHVSFFDVSAWSKTAETCKEYLSKGSKVGIDGRLRQRRWETDSGDKRSAVSVVADQVAFLSPKPDGGRSSSSEPEIPFAYPLIPDRETRRRDLFTGDRLP